MFRPEIKPGFNKRSEFKHRIMDKIVDHYADISVEGTSHLEDAREIIEAGHDVTVVMNHLSNLDAPVFDRSLELSGYQDLEERVTYVLGLKLVHNSFTRHLTDAYDHILVIPKGYSAQTEEEEKEVWQVAKSAASAIETAKEDQKVIVLYPEGTRSREGKMQQGLSQAASYVRPRKGRESYVVPVGLDGTYEMFPPGQKFPKSGDIFVRVGQPIAVSEIDAPRGGEGKQVIVDSLMTEVARLLPDERRGFYESYVV